MLRTETDVLTPPKKPSFLVLDASALEGKAETDNLRAYVQYECIKFTVSPDPFSGPRPVPLREEARVLCDLDDFDNMYDLTMQYLAGRTLTIEMRCENGEYEMLDELYVQSKDSDLRAMLSVAEYPYIVYWLVEFMAALLSKQFPLPGKEPARTEEKKKAKKEAGKPKST